MTLLVLIVFYQIYKSYYGPGPGAGGKAAKGKKGNSGNSWFGAGNMLGNMSKSKISVYGEDKKIETRFKDVAGNENAK